MPDRDALRLLTWLSPAFPVGAYSYSHGLEYALEAGLIADRETLIDWIDGILSHGAGIIDAVFLIQTHRAATAGDAERLTTLVEQARAWRGTVELAQESGLQGRAFLSAVRAAWPNVMLDRLVAPHGDPIHLLPYAVAVGIVAAVWQVRESYLVRAYLTTFTANLISAGVRLIPLGQTDGLRAQATLEETIERTASAALGASLDHLGSAARMVDWTSARHETQATRLFRS